MFSVQYTAPEKLKTPQSLVSLDLSLKETRAEKSNDYRDVIVFEKLHFQDVLRPYLKAKPAFANFSSFESKSSGLVKD